MEACSGVEKANCRFAWQRAGKLLTWGMIVFMVLNAGISSLAMTRYTQRSAGIPAETALEQRLDERFPDARMERIYPNAILVD